MTIIVHKRTIREDDWWGGVAEGEKARWTSNFKFIIPVQDIYFANFLSQILV